MKDIKLIWDRRVAALADLEAAIKRVDADLKRLKQKIASNGVDGYYSANSDVLRNSESVWRSCRQLQLLRELQAEEDALNVLKDDITDVEVEECEACVPESESRGGE